MPAQVDPRYFQFGNAFMGGMEQAQQDQRRNAMLDLEQRQQGLVERRFNAEEQARAAQAQQQQISREALAKFFVDHGFPAEFADFPEGVEIYKHETQKQGAGTDASSIQEYNAAKASGFGGSYLDFVQAKAKAGQAAPTPGYSAVQLADGSWGAFDQRTGQVRPTGQQAPPPKPTPESEADKKVGVLYGSMIGAENAIQGLSGADTSSKWDAVLGSTPVTKIFQGDAFRKYESAAKRWSANLLYIKSGATATPEEVNSTYKQFFPQPGDGAQVIAQKSAARQEELGNIRTQYQAATSKYGVAEATKTAQPAAKRVKFSELPP